MQSLRELIKKVLPARALDSIRRRLAVRRYLKELGVELYDRHVRMTLADFDGEIATRQVGFYERMAKEVAERSDLVLQALDRRLEGLSARHGRELRELREEVAALRESLERLMASAPSD